MSSIPPPSAETILAIRSTAVPTNASSASAGRMSMHSYSLNIHLLWSGRPPTRGGRRMRAAQSVRDVVSGGEHSLAGDAGVPVEPIPEHVSDPGWLLRRDETRHEELTGNRSLGKRVAAPIERASGQDPEPSIAQRQDFRPWLFPDGVGLQGVGHPDRLLTRRG